MEPEDRDRDLEDLDDEPEGERKRGGAGWKGNGDGQGQPDPPPPGVPRAILSYPFELYVGVHFPFFFAFSYALAVVTWPPAALVGAFTGRQAREVRPYLLFGSLVRASRYSDFAGPETVERWNQELEQCTPRERRAMRVFPLLFASDLSLTGFINVVLLRAPFRLEPVGLKRLSLQVAPDGEPLSGGERWLILCTLGLLPALILLTLVVETLAIP